MPYFFQVDGVAAYVGGLLSHASIVLRESRLPSVTQLPLQLELRTGDWVEMDGWTGEVRRVDSPRG
jgi:phosphoenolpyruvate-protein kinase (PTS system EI component)